MNDEDQEKQNIIDPLPVDFFNFSLSFPKLILSKEQMLEILKKEGIL